MCFKFGNLTFCSRSHQLEPLLRRIEGYVHRNAFNFMQSLTLKIEGVYKGCWIILGLFSVVAHSSEGFILESLTDYFRSRTPLAEGLAAWFDLDLSHLGPNCNLDPSLFLESLTPHTSPTQVNLTSFLVSSLSFFFSPKGCDHPERVVTPVGPVGPHRLRYVTSGSFSFRSRTVVSLRLPPGS